MPLYLGQRIRATTEPNNRSNSRGYKLWRSASDISGGVYERVIVTAKVAAWQTNAVIVSTIIMIQVLRRNAGMIPSQYPMNGDQSTSRFSSVWDSERIAEAVRAEQQCGVHPSLV
jgi:hypothetical protein